MRFAKICTLLLAAALLSGCATLFSYLTPRQFDPVEYGTVVSVVQTSTRTINRCKTARSEGLFVQFLNELNTHSMYLVEYTSNKKGNDEAAIPAKHIRTLVLEFDAYAVDSTPEYCVIKLSNVQNASRTLARALGNHSQYNFCEANLMSLYERLNRDRDMLLSREYKELANDIVRLGQVNLSACDLRQRAQIEQAISIISKVASLVPF